MRKQTGFLEHVAQWPLVRRQPVATALARVFVVLPDLAVDRQATQWRTLQPGHAAQQRGFAGA